MIESHRSMHQLVRPPDAAAKSRGSCGNLTAMAVIAARMSNARSSERTDKVRHGSPRPQIARQLEGRRDSGYDVRDVS